MHIFFRGVRVHKRKEFFAVSAEDINAFFDTEHADCDQWTFALKKAAFGRAPSVLASLFPLFRTRTNGHIAPPAFF